MLYANIKCSVLTHLFIYLFFTVWEHIVKISTNKKTSTRLASLFPVCVSDTTGDILLFAVADAPDSREREREKAEE